MIVYHATKIQFLKEAPEIQDIVRAQVKATLLIDIKPSSSEYKSWQNSIGNAMFHVINSSNLADDVSIAIEFGIPFSRKRIDFVIGGESSKSEQKVLIIELKQWSQVEATNMDAIVRTWLGRKLVETNHPSYQALTYAHLLKNFNENVASTPIKIATCSFLHNNDQEDILNNAFYEKYTTQSPVFLKSDRENFIDYINKLDLMSDSCKVVELLSSSEYRPTQELANKLTDMMQGNEAFMLVDSQKIIFEKILDLIKNSSNEKKKQVIIVSGGPGTGKSVVAINLLAAAIISHKKNAHMSQKTELPEKCSKLNSPNHIKNQKLISFLLDLDHLYNQKKMNTTP